MAQYRVTVEHTSIGHMQYDLNGKKAALEFLKKWAETGLRVSPDERINLTIEKQ